MATVILDDSQASQIATAASPVEARDRHGSIIGVLVPGFAPAELARAKESLQSDGARLTTPEVLEHLRGLRPS